MVTDIAERVRTIIVMHLAAEETRVTEDAKFIGDLGADSLDVFELGKGAPLSPVRVDPAAVRPASDVFSTEKCVPAARSEFRWN